MCKYCEPINGCGEIYGELAFTKYNDSIFGEWRQDLVIENYEDDEDEKQVYIVSGFFSYYGDGEAYIKAKINYCPMCGRKLGGD